MSDGSDKVHLPTLLNLAYPELEPDRARMAVCRGNVSVNGRTVGLTEMDIPRADLRSATITCGRRPPFVIDAEGRRIVRTKAPTTETPSKAPAQTRLL